jgi:hypothetical protein
MLLFAALLAAQDVETPLRVLLVESGPRFEYRHLRGALLKDPAVRLRSFLSSADDEWEQPASPGETPLTRRSALRLLAKPEGVDVLIWGDLRPERLAPGISAGLEAFVRGGGGLLYVAGASTEAGGIGPLFPLGPAPARPAAAPEVEALVRRLGGDDIEAREEAAARLKALGPPAIPGLRAALPGADGELRDRLGRVLEEIRLQAAQEATPIRATASSPEAWRKELWTRAPRLRWWLRATPPSDAEIWVETAGGDPLLAFRKEGKGRVALLATDEWWLWRRERGDADYYATYRDVLRRLAGR